MIRTRLRILSGDERGMALILMLMVMGLVMTVAALMASQVRANAIQQGAHAQANRNFYAAEAGLNRGMAEFGNIFLDLRVPAGNDFNERSFHILNNQDIRYQLTDVPGNPRSVTLPAGDVFAGLNSIQYRYTVASKAMANTGIAASQLGAEFEVNNIPVFQFVAFYKEDLEIMPGPNMFLHGRVHTNESLYVNSNNTLRIEDNPPTMTTVQVSTAGGLYRGRKNANSCTGTVVIDKLEDVAAPSGNLDPVTLACSGGSTRVVSTSEVAAWNSAQKTPAAVIGDSLNVLSQDWEAPNGSYRNDQKNRLALANRRAISTTINAAFLAGVDRTTTGNYNGGLENHPRFHETWSWTSNITLTHRGSFVSFGTPLHANGAWCGTGGTCNIYNPPTRNWDYDTDFNNVANFPPLTPRFVYLQQLLFSQEFK